MAFDVEAMRLRALVPPAAMAKADERTIEAGTPRATLIARAARACLRVLRSQFTRRPVIVLAGPGHNGEDGLALAELLIEAGWPVTIIDLGGSERQIKNSLTSHLRPSGTFAPGPDCLVVDALFGAGLSRPVEGEAKSLIEKIEGSGAAIMAIDLPSGIDGATGEVLGVAPEADVSVTFHRLKPGHLIGEGARRAGRLFLCDIGILGSEEDAAALHNTPSLWRGHLAPERRETHKYARGHVVVVGGPGLKGGAARLSARAASVSGAGAVTFMTPLSAAEFAGTAFDAVMVGLLNSPDDLEAMLDAKATSVVLGPGMGHGKLARACLDVALESGLPTLLDADALTLYEDAPETLFAKVHEACVLTPHEGEFARLFAGISGDKLLRTKEAAKRAGAIVLLKGSTTVIAGDALPVINTNGSPALATAGSGDVLSGLIGGLLAKGIAPQEAAAMGAWIHAEAARNASPSLNADQLPERIAKVIGELSRPCAS